MGKPKQRATRQLPASSDGPVVEQAGSQAADRLAVDSTGQGNPSLILKVLRTSDRGVKVRDFIVRLSDGDRHALHAEPGDWVQLTRLTPVHGVGTPPPRLSVLARIAPIPRGTTQRPCPTKGEIGVDHALRVAIGVPSDGEAADGRPDDARVRVRRVPGRPRQSLSRVRTWLQRLLWSPAEWWVGTQAHIMRVDFAMYEDMEIPVARMPQTVFDVIGVNPGGFIRIESTESAVVVRASTLHDSQGQFRKVQRDAEQAKPTEQPHFIDWPKALHLGRITGGLGGQDIPPILIDEDLRSRLDAPPGSPVRIVRDVRHQIRERAYAIFVPALLSTTITALFVLWDASHGSLNGWYILLAFLLVLLVSLGMVVVEVRNRIK
jgi:hypothetical protein